MKPQPLPLDSDALRANISSTAQCVVIPDRYQPLIAAAAGFHGVQAALNDALREYFHSYRNVDSLVESFQAILLRNWPYLERSPQRVELFALLNELVADLLRADLSEMQFSLLLRSLLGWYREVLSRGSAADYEASFTAMAETLGELLVAHSHAFLERDTSLRGVLKQARSQPPVAAAFAVLYRRLLTMGYERVLYDLDIPGWAQVLGDGLTDAQAVADAFAFSASEKMSALIERVRTVADDELLGDDMPLYSDLLAAALSALSRVENLEDRFAVCLFLLKDDALSYRQKEAMVALLAVVKELAQPSRHTDTDRLLSRLTGFFRGRDNEFLLMRFQCYQVIGIAIGEAGNVRAADHLIEDILSWQFQYPEIEGATDDWETIVNPYHLPKIRCWMHIIESNPSLFERLAAALNVQLRLGGVYIADTDLFQRDVTRFLNADIYSIYFVAKQLLRAFPVFFNEVGAEGELRAVSTQLDEISERRDTLAHFLRKQVHAESSNRLIPFSREVLLYWLTLETAPLEPYVSTNTLEAIAAEVGLAAGPRSLLTELCRLRLRRASEAAAQAEAANRDDLKGAETDNGRGQQWDVGADAAGDAFCDAEGERGDGSGLLATQAGITGAEAAAFVDELLQSGREQLQDDLAALVACLPEGDRRAAESDARRIELIVRTHQLVREKYSLTSDDIVSAVDGHSRLQAGARRGFVRALRVWQAQPLAHNRDRLLDAALTVLEELKEIILDPATSEAVENLYQKRHIAAGIPSIYGNYSEPKFDALGLSFRLEQLVSRLLDDVVDEGVEQYVTRASLRRMAAVLRRLKRALAIDGIDSGAFTNELAMLQASFGSQNFTFHQYQNIFQFLVSAVSELCARSVLSHDQVLHTMLVNDPRQVEARGLTVDGAAEMVLREVLVSGLGLQALDRYAAAALRRVSTLNERLDANALTKMMNYDPERLVSPIHTPRRDTDDQVTLGFKGFGLKQMAAAGLRVPEGFILSTELYQALPAMSYPPFYRDMIDRVHDALEQLEQQTKLRLGDRDRPLLLSIRSGAPISMPGLMTTFVNVGLNDDLVEDLADRPGFAWAAWDSYRRFIQSWAMSEGIDRDFFDNIMAGFKSRYGVEQKLEFSVEQMRRIAYAYKLRAEDEGVVFVRDPFAQVVSCISKVLASWNTADPRLYREYTGIAQEWGTGVVVQRMVFGNLSRLSGSGVTFTSSPLEPYSQLVRLFGDFAVCSQGEDLVGGLVFPLPISEAQRLASPTYRDTHESLEKDFPEVYEALLKVGRQVVGPRGVDPQEIEFTFESSSADGLYILQKRAVVPEQRPDADHFDTASPLYGPPATVGMGVAGGAYSGRVAVNAQQIDRLLAEAPDEGIILLRPDTVPEDIAMITRVDGILTGRGGATSHAAVTAKRLGKTAVVECLDLEVVERQGYVRLAGRRLDAGDWLSIDGRTGNIYFGRIPTMNDPPASQNR